jgi:hypothetical protein
MQTEQEDVKITAYLVFFFCMCQGWRHSKLFCIHHFVTGEFIIMNCITADLLVSFILSLNMSYYV